MFSVSNYAGFAAGGTRAITPPNTTNLVAWYDFADAATISTSGTATISTIRDKSTNTGTATAHGTLGDATARPTLTGTQNGYSAAEFPGGATHGIPYLLANNQITWSGISYVAAAQLGTVTNAYIDLFLLSNNGVEARYAVPGTQDIFQGGWPAFAPTAGGGSSGQWHVFAFAGTTGTQTLRLDGGQSTGTSTLTQAVSFADSISDIGLAGNTGKDAFIGELRLFTGAVSLSDLQKEEGYLAWKWGLQGNLPSNHPYKNAPP